MNQLLILLGAAVTVAISSTVNPLGKVFELITDLQAKIESDGEAEEKSFKEYTEWCDDFKTEKGFEIKDGKASKEKLEATIAELTAMLESGASKIDELAASIQKSSAELKNATSIRESEAGDFAKSEKELMEVIETLGRASTLLEKELKTSGAAALTQLAAQARSGATGGLAGLLRSLDVLVDAASLPVVGKQRLLALVQSQASEADEDDTGELAAPAAAVYESKSGSIVDVLDDLKEKAEEQLGELRKSEVSAKHSYAMLKQSLEDGVAADTIDMDSQKQAKASAEQKKAAAEGDLTVTVADLKEAEVALETTSADCAEVTSDHEASVAARLEELKVIAEAEKILKGSTGGAEAQEYSFLQRSSSRSSKATPQSQVVVLVRDLAKRTHSAALAQLASRVAAVMRSSQATGGPFDKVKDLISGMIEKLETEAGEEASEKAFCDEETAKTVASKEELDDKVGKLTTNIDQASARSTKLKEEVATLQEELAKMEAEWAELTKVREDMHAAYVTAKADYEDGLTGVRKALGVLRDYYAKDAEFLQDGSKAMAALFQQEPPPKPSTFKAATGTSSGIIGILETVESDFASSLSKVEMEEAAAQETYEKTVDENTLTKATKTKDVEYKTKEATSLDKTIAELKSDLATVSSELEAVVEYKSKLDERCIAKPETYEERKARRESEIAGLKEALAVLKAEASSFVQRRGKRNWRMRGSSLRSSE